MTRSELLAVVYRFYPRGLTLGTDAYNRSEERERQWEAARRGRDEYHAWKGMIRRLGARYPVVDHAMSLLGGGCEPGYSGDIRIQGSTLGFHVSLLGPYYGIRRIGAPGEDPAAIDLAREIESSYPGYQAIPPELGDEVVPEVIVAGKSTIYVCLLSEVWPWSSGPTDAESPAAKVPDAESPQMEGVVQRLESVTQLTPQDGRTSSSRKAPGEE